MPTTPDDRGPDFTPENEAADEQRMFGDSFDGASEPMRALRDLIGLCELTMGSGHGGSHEEQAVLSRAREGFESLRKLFGDERPAEDTAFGPMIEPNELIDAFQATAGALQCVAPLLQYRERHLIRFTGKWSRFGYQTVGNVLNRADEALGREPSDARA